MCNAQRINSIIGEVVNPLTRRLYWKTLLMTDTNKTDVLSKMNMNKDSGSKTNMHKVTKTIVTSPNIYKPVGPYRFENLILF